MKYIDRTPFFALVVGFTCLVSCDSEKSEEVTEILDARNDQVDPVFPDEFVSGSSFRVTTLTNYDFVADSGDDVTVTSAVGLLGVQGKYSYTALDEAAVFSVDFIDEVAVDDGDGRAPYYSVASSAPFFADLVSGNNVQVAQGLNDLVVSEGFQQTYFDVDENGQIFLVESMVIDIDLNGDVSLIRSGSLIDIDGSALDPLATAIYFDLDRDFTGGGSTPNYVRVYETGVATFN